MLFVRLNILHAVSWLNSISYNYILFSLSQTFLAIRRGCSVLLSPGLDIWVAVFQSHHHLSERQIELLKMQRDLCVASCGIAVDGERF